MAVIPFPPIHPEIYRSFGPYAVGDWSIGPFALRWYALAYIVGLILGWRYCLAIAKKPPVIARPVDIDDFLVWATLGVVLGGRLGYVLFYNPAQYIKDPIEVLYLWHGGMSFHGGAAGVFLAIFLFCRLRNIPFLALGDIICCAVPIGLFFGRIANFINDELWGRGPTSVAWAMTFPSELLSSGDTPQEQATHAELVDKAIHAAEKIDPSYNDVPKIIAAYRDSPELREQLSHILTPRHPSQIYEALLEGVVLFLVLWLLQRGGGRQRPGLIAGVFLMGYGLARFTVEFFREPDAQLLWLVDKTGISMGQWLSLPLVIVGLWLVRRAKKTVTAPA